MPSISFFLIVLPMEPPRSSELALVLAGGFETTGGGAEAVGAGCAWYARDVSAAAGGGAGGVFETGRQRLASVRARLTSSGVILPSSTPINWREPLRNSSTLVAELTM